MGLDIEDTVWNHSVFSKNSDRLIEYDAVTELFNATVVMAGHVPETAGHDAENTGHALPKYAAAAFGVSSCPFSPGTCSLVIPSAPTHSLMASTSPLKTVSVLPVLLTGRASAAARRTAKLLRQLCATLWSGLG